MMSIRGSKRMMGARGEAGGASKRRKTEHEDALWRLRPVSDLKIASIYNRSASEAPAELFRKDLISAMKIADSEALNCQEYWIITDTWKQEWERGVQVPVNPDSLPAPTVHEIENPLPPNFQEFKLPKNKYIHLNRDAFYQPEIHQLSTVVSRAEAACKYDLDAVDSAWLKILNGERARAGSASITEDQLERVIQELELRCWDKIQAMMKSEEALGIEYDENVICDVCRSPDSEEGNEMVFCDACNICVHQACYGITTIPSGQWLCRPCGERVRPSCVLCPNLGGAMKCTPSGQKWAHVSCALWIPEVSIGCAEKMEPITKISSIPASRRSLLCVLCKGRKGACIQCSVKTCKTAYHVTCAFKHGLEMRAIIEDENADDGVKLRSYCQKHSVTPKKDKNSEDNSEEDEVKRKRRKDMSSEEKSQARAMRLHEIEAEFDKHVSIKDISTHLLDIDQDAIGYIYSYWKLKRRAGHNRPLLPPKADDSDFLSHRQEQADLDKMKMFVQLRQDLERVRNLCYMVSRREKLSRSFFRMREQTFHKQVAVLSEQKDLNAQVVAAVIEANHGPSIYDRMYSHPAASDNSNDFNAMMARIAEIDSEDDKKDINGVIKSRKIIGNPYKKAYVNGSTRRSGSMFSGISSEDSAPEISRGQKYNKQAIGSSTDEDDKQVKKKISPVSKNKLQVKTERKKRVSSRHLVDSSSEEDVMPTVKKEKSAGRSRTLQALEREMSPSGTDSDDLIKSICKGPRNSKFPMDIYSDSSEASNPSKLNEYNDEKSPNMTKDSTQPFPRTKAEMKQFIPVQKSVLEKAGSKRGRKPSSSREKLIESDEDAKNKENIKLSKGKEYPSDLIVPQRQAAKKASENIRSTTKPKESESTMEIKPALTAEDTKIKSKTKVKSRDDKITPTKEQNKKKNLLTGDSNDFEKDEKDQDLIAYVPQRQAAKKAAAHIKSGLGNKPSGDITEEAKKKEAEVKTSPRKDDDKHSKSSSSSSSSSSNSSSSSCSSSSSSDEEESVKGTKPHPKRQQSLFSPAAPRPSVDLPFLNKVSRPLSSSSPSSDSDTKEWQRGKSSTVERAKSNRAESSGGSDGPSHEAPEKKFKTSERQSECRVSSSPAQREKRSGTSDTKSASRSRPRSTALPSGDLPHERDARSRKPAHLSGHIHAQNQSSEEITESRQSSTSKWKADKTLNSKESERECQDEDVKQERGKKTHSLGKTKESPKQKSSKPLKTLEKPRRTSFSHRKTSVSDFSPPKDENAGADNSVTSEISKSLRKSSSSPKKSASPKKSKQSKFGDSSPSVENSSIIEDSNLWMPHAKSPAPNPISVDSYKDSEKYAAEDKSLDDRSSYKMIAKIQANLNENTLIKSPKTPMDATSGINDTDNETLDYRLRKKTPSVETQEKFQGGLVHGQETNVQNVDTHKKNQPNYPNRSIFSPQPIKDNPCSDLFDFGNNIRAVDDSMSDGFGNEEIMKPFSFTSEFLFKEDSKEGVQETLNLVEKLRMTLSSKKTAADNNEPENTSKQTEGAGQQEEVEKVDEEKEVVDEPSSPPVESTRDADKSQASNTSLVPSNESTQDNAQELTIEPIRCVTPEALQTNKWQYPTQTNESHTTNHPAINYDENKHYEHHQHPEFNTKQFSEHIYEGNQYKDKNYESERFHDRTFEEKQYDEKHYERVQYDDKQYADKTYAEKLYEKHAQYQQHTESQESEKCSKGLQNEMQSSSDPERFIDSMSKQSDDSRSIVDPTAVSDHDPVNEDVGSQSYENNNSLPQSDCATISSPYREDDRLEGKWGESKITQRRSSASSTNSEGSVCSQKLQIKPHMPNASEMIQEMEYASIRLHQHLHPAAHPTEAIPYSSFSSEASPFVTHGTSLFQPGTSTALPFQSPGAGFFPPNLSIPYNTTPMISNLPKPFTSICNVFTSTSQNLTLNAPTIPQVAPKPIEESPPDDMDLSTEKSFSRQPSPSPSADSFNDTSSVKISKLSNDSNDTICTQSTLESRSSSKPMRTSNRFIGSGKSPGKSPGFSPKTVDSYKSSTSKRSTSSKSSRGRGRGRSRSRGGQSLHGFPAGSADYQGTIHSTLAGTVYELDIDEETANDGVDLKSMRDRRRSVEVHDKKLEISFKDSLQSPRVVSPLPSVSKKVSLTPDNKEVRPSVTTVVMKETPFVEGSSASKSSDPAAFPAIVQPVLPGPVDMRRYQPLEIPSRDFQFGSFEAVASHQPLEFDEESEKELQKRLANNPPATPPKSPARGPIEQLPIFTPETPMPKVSLSDSRNQLKVKIKGPFRDANYSATVPAVVAQPPRPTYETPPGVLGTPSAVASASSEMLSGTSNLRRMRKKELLRQYWTQDMNMDDPAMNPPVPPPVHQSPLSRTIITIPKAVASMTTIPTREDYKAVVDANMEKKKRKAAGDRELRYMHEEDDSIDDLMLGLPSFNTTPVQPPAKKARGRGAIAKPNKPSIATPVAPKLKIKISSNIVQPVTAEEPTSGSSQFRPPKKRLPAKEVTPPTPSYEDLRRESMKFRKMMMAKFDDGKKEKKHKPKGEKTEKKKKKGKKADKHEVVNSKSDSVTKLVIKISRNKEEKPTKPATANPVDPFEYDPSAPDPLAIDPPSFSESCSLRKLKTSKVTPIRLKLARSSEGSGYVMKESDEGSSSSRRAADSLSDTCEAR